jgi:hypothetical protein
MALGLPALESVPPAGPDTPRPFHLGSELDLLVDRLDFLA